MIKKLFFLLLAAVMVSCGGRETANQWRAKHVIFIGLDGLTSAGVKNSNCPNIKSVMEAGCYTLEKRTVNPSVSGPNWAAMFTGVPVEMSGITGNEGHPTYKPLLVNENGVFPTVFSEIRKANPEAEMGCVMEWWSGIRPIIDEKVFNYVQNVEHSDIGCMECTEFCKTYITEKKPAVLYIHIDQPDHAGHGQTYDSDEYNKALEVIDTEVGAIIQAVKDAGIYDESVILLSSDHGGLATGHGGTSMNEMETLFAICGKGIKKGGQMTDVMMQFDIAPTIGKVFGLQEPQYWRGKAADVFEK